jgi:hypothetical protein
MSDNMIISDTKISEKILEFYLNNQETRTMSEFEKGYFQCLTDINAGKFREDVKEKKI